MDKIQEGNKIIAEFMDLRVDSFPNGLSDKWFVDTNNPDSVYNNNSVNDSKFHTSWDWLMPVVEKIFLLRETKDVIIRLGFVQIKLNTGGKLHSPHSPINSAIIELWDVVIQFIKWYSTLTPELIHQTKEP